MFPGLAVAHHLMDQGWQVRWLGTADRMEADSYRSTVLRSTLFVFLAFVAKALRPSFWRRCVFSTHGVSTQHHEALSAGCGAGHGRLCFRSGGLAAWSLGIPVVLRMSRMVLPD